jgi:nicotinamide mononucleotide transporter
VSIGLYWYKGLHLTAYLYAFFLLIAIQGYLEWRRNYEARVTVG